MSAPAVMNCPTCGAPVASDATSCGHCGSRLAVVACPSCFGTVFAGAKFCSHCGAAIAREEVVTDKILPCPRCKGNMEAVLIGKTHLNECPKCEGIWADAASLNQIYADKEQQVAVLGTAAPLPQNNTIETDIRYLPCPVCNKLMNRVNFAQCSHVIVDVCKAHGTWFDKDELRRIVEFIRTGGLDRSRSEELYELDRKRQQLNSVQAFSPMETTPFERQIRNDHLHGGIAAAAVDLISSFFFR